jgi:hypothetical protein
MSAGKAKIIEERQYLLERKILLTIVKPNGKILIQSPLTLVCNVKLMAMLSKKEIARLAFLAGIEHVETTAQRMKDLKQDHSTAQ